MDDVICYYDPLWGETYMYVENHKHVPSLAEERPDLIFYYK